MPLYPDGPWPRFLYLHGFASGPSSRKAQFFASRLCEEGAEVDIPALDGGDFTRLTLTGQLERVTAVAGNSRLVLIGSSMGGYLASLYAARNSNVEGLVLLSPAFGFLPLWRQRMGEPGLEKWRKDGTVSVFHYSLGQEVPLRYDLIEDAARYELEPEFSAPALIFHGNADDVVPVENSVQYARRHPHVELVRMNSGHELTDVLEPIWSRSKPFLQALQAGLRC